jgi:hypothetical protein
MDSGFLNFLGVFLAIGLGGGLCAGSIFVFKALATRLERRSVGDDQLVSLQSRIVELERSQIGPGELESLATRTAELEERVDFAERLLAQGERKPAQLG